MLHAYSMHMHRISKEPHFLSSGRASSKINNIMMSTTTKGADGGKGKKRKTGERDNFPSKLFAMLQLAGTSSSGGAVSWLPHGYAFRILDEDRFVEEVVPMFFGLTKIRSFYRQLSLWGFKR